MRATTLHGAFDIRLAELPDPQIHRPTDALVRVTAVSYTHLTLPTKRIV